MIIARGHNDETGDQFIMLGLSRENINRLTKGELISVTQRSHGDGVPDGWQIVLHFGETEEDIAAQLKQAGAVDEATLVHKLPRGAK